jgi:glutamate-ammonia-ligase adenylyltransferase
MDLPSPEVATGTLAERVVTTPRLSGPEAARQRLDGWLAEIAQTPAGAALKQVLAGYPQVRALLEGIADGSSYLWDLARADPDRLVALLDADPDRRLEALIVGVTTRGTVSDDDIMRQLRRMKAEGALLIALADIGGVWPITRVIAALTELADAAVAAAVRHLLADAVERGRYRPADPARPEAGSGFIVLAMGKMGSGELNYSSDIDLIVFYDAAAATLAAGVEPSPFYVRLTQRLI